MANQSMGHIGKSSKPVVLLIDELNRLCSPGKLEEEKSLFLHFLDPTDRYLVFTSHFCLNIDSYMPGTSGRSSISATLFPRARNEESIRGVPNREAVTKAETIYYSSIPSLIYCAKNHEETVFARFSREHLAIPTYGPSADAVPRSILSTLEDGVRRGYGFRKFEQFSESTISTILWPMCYIGCILRLLLSLQRLQLAKIITDVLPIDNETVHSGKEWEDVVLIAILLKCLGAKFGISTGPFGMVQGDDVPIVVYEVLPSEISTLEDADKYINIKVSKCGSSVIIVAVFSYARFPLLDGLIFYKSVSGNVITMHKLGWQSKAGIETSTSNKNVPDWLSRIYLLRGRTLTDDYVNGKWECLGRKRVQSLLGYSLGPLIPSMYDPK